MKIEIYSDIVCPWCYIGERRFALALRSFQVNEDVEVCFRAYQLDPDLSSEGMPLKTYLRRRYGTSVRAMIRSAADAAHAEGINMHFESAVAANTFEAHRLMRLALNEYGCEVQRALASKLFAAHFEHGLDVSAHSTLMDLSEAAGMRRERVSAFLQSAEGEQDVHDDLERARSLGISGVPTFIFDGRFAVQGAQPAAVFLQVMNEVASESA